MSGSSQRFATVLLIVGFICLAIWFFGGSVGSFIVSSAGGFQFLVNIGETIDSSTNIFFVFGIVLVIAAFVVWAIEQGLIKF
jgi:hypothetical protein